MVLSMVARRFVGGKGAFTQGRPVRAIVHCVVHKCIMVKVGGHEKYKKYVKTSKFYENSRGKFEKYGGK